VKLGELAARLGLALEGDPALEIRGVASLDDAGPGELSFAMGPRYASAFAGSRAGAFLLPPDFEARGRSCLRSLAPYADFARAIELLMPSRHRPQAGVHATAVVAPDAVLGRDVSIGAYAVVGPRCRLGDRSVIHPHVTLYSEVWLGADCVIHSGAHLREGTRLGDRVVVQNGAVIGSDGFGHAFDASGRRVAVPHRSPVEIGDDCEIGANTTIDASHPAQPRRGAPATRTYLGPGVKVDNLVQIAHGCSIGAGSTLSAQVGLAGSTVVGRNVTLGGQAGVAGHLEIGSGALVGGKTGVVSDVEPGAAVLGYPQVGRRQWGRIVAVWKRLPELWRRVRRIEEKLGIEAGERERSEE
jgi:UDP-3-O-[3-hydroxymyristoyl] glucosamine N-acyltransferase